MLSALAASLGPSLKGGSHQVAALLVARVASHKKQAPAAQQTSSVDSNVCRGTKVPRCVQPSAKLEPERSTPFEHKKRASRIAEVGSRRRTFSMHRCAVSKDIVQHRCSWRARKRSSWKLGLVFDQSECTRTSDDGNIVAKRHRTGNRGGKVEDCQVRSKGVEPMEGGLRGSSRTFHEVREKTVLGLEERSVGVTSAARPILRVTKPSEARWRSVTLRDEQFRSIRGHSLKRRSHREVRLHRFRAEGNGSLAGVAEVCTWERSSNDEWVPVIV